MRAIHKTRYAHQTFRMYYKNGRWILFGMRQLSDAQSEGPSTLLSLVDAVIWQCGISVIFNINNDSIL